MTTEPIPSDRAVQAALRKLKAYSAYKGRQTQSPIDRNQALDSDLGAVETWAQDSADDGKAWYQARSAAAEQDELQARRWREAVERDEKQAAQEEALRRQMPPDKLKEELKRQIDEHAAGVAALAEAKEPGFRGKLSQVRKDSLRAKKYIDEDLEKSLEDTARRTAAERQQRKEVAQKFEARAKASREWRARHYQKPEAYPQGQREDVRAALGRISEVAGARADELTPLGAEAAPYRERLARVQSWAAEADKRVDTPPPARAAKAETLPGVAETRSTFADLDAFGAGLERESNEHFATFRNWTQANTERARAWINSDSAKHREWAEAWLGRKGAGQSAAKELT